MTRTQYDRIYEYGKNHSRLTSSFLLLNKGLTCLGFLAYPLLLVILLIKKQKYFLSCIFIPGLCFLMLSLFRILINRKRPYEKLPITPLIKKETKGHSFPSRHVFSIFLIATLWLSLMKPAGIVLFLAGFFLAAIRVIGGVHFLSDVVAGGMFGILSGFLTVFFCR
ncbi:MAG: phosphatase PAP2 family protein [Anaerobutyricum sp.]|nr:phosphatase PAP2 family protein [Anaerobutyricum sp.]